MDFPKYRERLAKKIHISPNGVCQLWGGGIDNYGYGRIKVRIAETDHSLTVHRLSYILSHEIELGDIAHTDVSHLCHNKLCIKKEHLSLEPHEINLNRRPCINMGRCLHHGVFEDCMLNLRFINSELHITLIDMPIYILIYHHCTQQLTCP